METRIVTISSVDFALAVKSSSVLFLFLIAYSYENNVHFISCSANRVLDQLLNVTSCSIYLCSRDS